MACFRSRVYTTDPSEESFNVHSLTPVEGDKSVFEKVVLDETKKDIVKTLVEGHMELTTQYDDLISGKGE